MGKAERKTTKAGLAPGGLWVWWATGAAAVVLVALVWLTPQPLGDLYMALAGGRDVAAGKLGTPDDWSFVTRPPYVPRPAVWINQSWGSHLILYELWRVWGDEALIALYGLLLLTLATLSARVAWKWGADGPAAMLAGGLLLSAGVRFQELRPNLIGLVAAALVLLLLSPGGKPGRRAGCAAAVTGLWANLHGSYLLGLALLTALPLLRAATAVRRDGAGRALRRELPALAAAGAALLAAAFLNPFGLWVQPLSQTYKDPVWQTISEWIPLLAPGGYGSVVGFFGVAGATLLLGVFFLAPLFRRRGRCAPGWDTVAMVLLLLVTSTAVWWAASRAGTTSAGSWFQAPALAFLLFGLAAVWRLPRRLNREPADGLPTAALALTPVLLAGTGTFLALGSRRFVPYYLVLASPLVGLLLSQASRRWGRRATWGGLAAAAAVVGTVLALPLLRYHDPRNPLVPPAGLAGRLTMENQVQPVGVDRFLADNGIAGRAFVDWRWEGWLRLHRPELQVFIGGRAQQVYPSARLHEYGEILAGPRAPALFRRYAVELVIVPAEAGTAPLLAVLAQPRSLWEVVYADGRRFVLAGTETAVGRGLAGRLAAGSLRFADPSVAGLSAAFNQLGKGAPFLDAESAFAAVTPLRPCPDLVRLYGLSLRREAAALPAPASLAFLAGRRALLWRLAQAVRAQEAVSANQVDALFAQQELFRLLGELPPGEGPPDPKTLRQEAERTTASLKAVLTRWKG